jgi:hypothetical protein
MVGLSNVWLELVDEAQMEGIWDWAYAVGVVDGLGRC